jgi:hypothetical protein
MSDRRTDDQLMDMIAAAMDGADPVPEGVLEAARATFTWRTIDAELAALVFDSAADDLVGVRSTETTRQMTFRTPGVEIELVVVSETRRRIVGQLVPPQEAEITLHHQDETRTARSDRLGRFTFPDVPSGSVRLTCKLADESGAVIQTEWTLI